MVNRTILDLSTNLSPPSIHQSLSTVHLAISKWDPHTSLSPSFLRATIHLHSHLITLTQSPTATSATPDTLIPTISLLQSAIDRLKQDLKLHLNSIATFDSSSDLISTVRSIIQTMIFTGYRKECAAIYISVRKSNISSRVSKLRFKFNPTNRKLKWEILGPRIKSWVDEIPLVIKSISNERDLCDEIFLSLDKSVRDDIFSSIVSDQVLEFFSFSESVSLNVKPSPEKLFSFLDMHSAIKSLLPDIESIFESDSNKSMISIRSHVNSSLNKSSSIIKSIISDLESAIKKDPLKSTRVSNGSIHPLSKYVMNYLVFLSDYESYLHEIFTDMPLECDSSFMELYSHLNYESMVSERIAWIIFMLLCKIDSHATSYNNNVALSYLFLTNNLQYIVRKVQNSGLREILGDKWLNNHIAKARKYMESHLRSGWTHVSVLVPSKQENLERISEFEMVFEKVLKEREEWVIADVAVREDARLAVRDMIVPVYNGWYRMYNNLEFDVKFSPEDLRERIMRLYDSDSDSGSSKYRRQFGVV